MVTEDDSIVVMTDADELITNLFYIHLEAALPMYQSYSRF